NDKLSHSRRQGISAMARSKAEQDRKAPATPAVARLAPAQRRSRERFERILACAEALLVEKGSDGFRMSDIVERADVPFGSLYQYFPDKTAIIGTLAERYNAVGRECVARELKAMRSADDLHRTLCRITDGFFRMYQGEPVMTALWEATLADRRLQALDREDCDHLAGLLGDALRPFVDARRNEVESFAGLTMALIGAAVRHAITLDERQAKRVLGQFKAMLPEQLAP